MRYKCLSFIVGLVCLILIASSCTSYKHIPYFVGLKDTTYKMKQHPSRIFIQKGDQLSIYVSCPDPIDALIFNQPNFSQPTPQSPSNYSINNPLVGYIVNQDGYILLPKIGLFKAVGMTKERLQDTLQNLLIPYLKEPQVSVRLLNYRISVLGEVGHPGIFIIPNEQVTILEAIGLAGDLSIYGRRDNVLLIRQNDSVGVVHYLNLQDKSILYSEYYYLQPGDVIYVTPNKVRANSTDETLQLLPIWLSILSTAIILVSYLGLKITIH